MPGFIDPTCVISANKESPAATDIVIEVVADDVDAAKDTVPTLVDVAYVVPVLRVRIILEPVDWAAVEFLVSIITFTDVMIALDGNDRALKAFVTTFAIVVFVP